MRTSPRVIAVLSICALLAGSLPAAAVATASPAAVLRPSIASALYRQADARGSTRVIVLLRGDAATAHPDTVSGASRHSSAVRAEQAPVVSLLRRAGAARNVHAYRAFSMISASVTSAGLHALAASPDVSAVVPDERVQDPHAQATTRPAGARPGAVTAPPGVCSTDPKKPQLNPQALQTTETESENPNAATARSLGATGAGVKVAIFPEGIDVNNPDFIRPDGSKVFTDYQDFTGDGTAAPTGAGEAFLDASSIASQGNETFNVSDYSVTSTTKPCYIKIEGVAPGASLVDMKIFNQEGYGYDSWILQAFDYAVDVDHVDVMSESVGAQPYPDTANDVLRQADEAAVAAGVSVIASSGDTGVTNELWSPSTAPGVISVAATTTYRVDLQTGYGGARFPGVTGYLNDNISSLSSGGEDVRGGTVDLSAPGELNWIDCTADLALYADCANYRGQPTNYQPSGGTSESAPLVAGGAALVIQAYRQTHGGATPSPQLIKRILVSTARDVAAPGDQQGAGELDTYRAVLAARSVGTPDGHPAQQGATLLTSSGQLNARGAPGTPVTRTFSVTNTGSSTQTVGLGTRALTQWTPFHSTSVVLNGASPHQVDWQGYNTPYEKVTFDVTGRADRLDASIAYHASSAALSARGRLTLVDPNGRLAAYSLPQGPGNYGDVQVAHPATGTWTAYVYSRPIAAGGSAGRYQFGWRTANYRTLGTVTPGSVTLAPGASRSVTFTTSTPAAPGDQAESILVHSPQAGYSTIPVTLRSYIPLSSAGTPFRGLLTGGNGRSSSTGEAFYYQFHVTRPLPALNALVALADNPNNPFYVSLVDPHGDQVGYGSNVFAPSLEATPTNQRTGVAHAIPQATGIWTLIVNFAPTVSGAALSEAFTVLLNSKPGASVTAPELPDNPKTTLPAEQPVTVPMRVTNTSGAPEAYFVDARNLGLADYPASGSKGALTLPGNEASVWLVPPDTQAVTATATSTVPIEFDYGFDFGDPDIEASVTGTTASGRYTAAEAATGLWFMVPAEFGPYGAVGAPQITATTSATFRTAPFDPAVTSSTGDLWSIAYDDNAELPRPVVVAPGHSATIPVTITPSGPAGSTVSGLLYVDDLAGQSIYGTAPNGNQVVALPYSYTIGR